MSKSDVRVLGLYQGIFQDAACAFPELEQELSKDYSSLRRAVETRGLRILTIDLCAVAKHFDRCLASGSYVSSGLPLTKRVSATNQAPRFLGGLVLRVFDKRGRLKDDPDVEAIFFVRQILLFLKKASYDCAQENINREVGRLLEHDRTLPQPDQSWESVSGEVASRGFLNPTREQQLLDSDADFCRRTARSLLWVLDKVSSILTSSLGSYDPRDWRFRHGPGAVSEGSRYRNKYCWETWEPHLEAEFPIADYGYHSFASWAHSIQHDKLCGSHLIASRLVAVPKTVDTPRLIAAEPASKQWCQQNLLDYFVQRSGKCWISKFVRFDDQTQNQRLCVEGSLGGDLCTIDLSAASDSVSCEFVGNLFRANPTLLRALRAVRTRHLRQVLDKSQPEYTSLRKYSMMGSAVTFPIESFGFLAICLSGVLYSRGLKPTIRNIRSLIGQVSVFGDDLVIPKDSWEQVTLLLSLCDFKVNANKSFKEGNFRESCGVDAFRGVSITPTYWRGPYTCEPESVASLIELHNHLYSRWLMVTASKVATRLAGFPSISVDSGATGLHSRIAVVLPGIPRFCKAHHVWKTRVLTINGECRRLPHGNESALFQYFTEDPSPFTKWVHGVQSRPRMSIRRRWVSVSSLTG